MHIFANVKRWFSHILFFLVPILSLAQVTDTGKPLPTLDDNENSLFYLQRTKNTNTIVYELNRTEDGRLDEDDPVKVYWRHFEVGKDVTNDLSFFEKASVYGVNSQKIANGFKIKLKAFKNRAINLVKNKAGDFVGQMQINGKMARLDRIYVESREGMILPTVLHVDLFGTDLTTGESVIERVLPN
ncbi:MAG: hypothetical protein ACI9P8_000045 [Bacteroidia bacterium]|jgi:hypothetical protein